MTHNTIYAVEITYISRDTNDECTDTAICATFEAAQELVRSTIEVALSPAHVKATFSEHTLSHGVFEYSAYSHKLLYIGDYYVEQLRCKFERAQQALNDAFEHIAYGRNEF